MGAPTSHRQRTSSAVSEGRARTQPIWWTMDWVPRTGVRAMLLDDKVHGLSGDDDDLCDRLASDAGLDLLVGECGGLDDVVCRAGGDADDIDELAVDLHRDLEFVFFREGGIALGPGGAEDSAFAAELFPQLCRDVGRERRDELDERGEAR